MPDPTHEPLRAGPPPVAMTPELEARLARHRASDEIVVGTKVEPMPARETEALAFIRAELEGGRGWPSHAALARHLEVKERIVLNVLDGLRRHGRVQVIAWRDVEGGGRKPAQWGLVPT